MATLTDAWEPANQLEHQLRDALRDGDQDAYFSLVSGAELFVPLTAGESDAAAPTFTWPTATREGRTHVLAYTSSEAGRTCLGPTYQSFARMTLSDMARTWPDQEWWLALNSGLPIEGYLPAWFIGQLTAGIAPIPGESPSPSSPAPEAVPAGTAPPPDAVRPEGVAGGPALDPRPADRPEQALPDAAPPPAPPLPPAPEATHLSGPDAPSLPESVSPTLPEPVRDEVISDPVPAAPSVPSLEGPFEVDEAPVVLHITPDADLAPLDEEERALLDAATRGDRRGFLRTLLGVRQIWVPVVESGDLMLAPGRPGFQWYVDDASGRPVVPLYTGPGRMRDAMGNHPFVLSDLAKVLRFWPDPALELVINGGTAIGASIPGDRVTPMSEQVDADAAARLANDFPAQSDAERQMFDVRDDPEMVVKVLMDTTVFLPVWSRTPPAVQTRPGDPSFPWSAVHVRGRLSVLAFTSFDWMKAAVGTTGFVMPTFAELLAGWPEHDWSVSVNPGTPIEIALSGEQIRTLGSAMAGRVAEDIPPPMETSPEPPLEPPPVAAEPPRPEATSTEPAETAQGGESETPASLDAPPVAETPPAVPASALPGPWAIMQKVVPHEQVAWHLSQAYDRVAGFVHRVQDVVDLNTPRLLYEALGLLREGSPFRTDDAEVHVIRWPAYRAGLYRVPFGGGSAEDLRAWGDSGWVIEPPPFGGDGFAPGSAGSIREYKIDSMRLPHGSEMYAIGGDGSERFVARYDADRLTWGDAE